MKKLPKWWGLINPVIIVLVFVSFIPLTAIYIARSTNSEVPRLSIISDMDNQPRFKAQQASALFADGRSMRRPVEGTVAREQEIGNPHLTKGIVGDEWATVFPPEIEVDRALLERGQERYNIYCATCHGFDGSGRGSIDTRATELGEMTWIPPSDYHNETVRSRPVGHLYNTVTNGIRTMPAYNKQIGVEDRWAIVAYVRALQISQAASIEDIPAEERSVLESMKPAPAEDVADDGIAATEPEEPPAGDETQPAPVAEEGA